MPEPRAPRRAATHLVIRDTVGGRGSPAAARQPSRHEAAALHTPLRSASAPRANPFFCVCRRRSRRCRAGALCRTPSLTSKLLSFTPPASPPSSSPPSLLCALPRARALFLSVAPPALWQQPTRARRQGATAAPAAGRGGERQRGRERQKHAMLCGSSSSSWQRRAATRLGAQAADYIKCPGGNAPQQDSETGRAL